MTEVSAALRKQLGEQVEVLSSRAGTRNAGAWEAFQRAKQTVAQGDSLVKVGDVRAATLVLSSADSTLSGIAAQDTKWSAPPALQANLNYRLARMALATGAGIEAVSKRIDAGLERAEKAVAASPNDADALEARGSLRYLRWLLNLVPEAESDKAVAEAEADLTASIKANPMQASAMNTLSHLLIVVGRAAEGKLTAGKSYSADPYLSDANRTVWRLFQVSHDLELAQEAKKWCDEGERRFPSDSWFVECRLWLLTQASQQPAPTAEAIWKAYDDFLAANKTSKPEITQRKGMMLAGVALLRAGLPDSARAVIARAPGSENLDPSGDLVYLEAMARSQLGDKDRAISLLSKYFAAHPQQQKYASRDESFWWKPLQDEPKYRALVGLTR